MRVLHARPILLDVWGHLSGRAGRGTTTDASVHSRLAESSPTNRNMLLDEHRETVLHARSISDQVIEGAAIRYESFERGDAERFLHLMNLGSIPRTKKATWKGKVSQTGGVAINRFGLPQRRNPPPYARLDTPVHMRRGGSPTHYVYRPGYTTKHIDVHPLALPLLEGSGPIYFCLEGSLKGDAVLSTGAAAISSTSVTTWSCKDLERMLPLLRNAPAVYIVPDSDFYSSEKYAGSFNPMVRWQTLKASQWLVSRGVCASVRVPWIGPVSGKVGIDDFLAEGRSLCNLATHAPRVLPQPLDGYHLTGAQRKILEWLLVNQGAEGAFYPSAVGAAVGKNRATVRRAYQRFEELGIMRVWQGRRVPTQHGFVPGPHVYRVSGALETSYGQWLQRTQGRLPDPLPPLKLEMSHIGGQRNERPPSPGEAKVSRG